jgi:hypothetical protein
MFDKSTNIGIVSCDLMEAHKGRYFLPFASEYLSLVRSVFEDLSLWATLSQLLPNLFPFGW